MITVICGTNRSTGNTYKVATHYCALLKNKNVDAQLLELEKLPHDFAFTETFNDNTEGYQKILDTYIKGVDKFVFVIPEYNGSFPGILKAFIDTVPPRDFAGKKVGLVGISAGKAGNLLGMDHLTGILHYLKMEVMSRKPKLSGIGDLVHDEGYIEDQSAVKILEEHIDQLLNF